jgi:hypothetical protein
MKANGVSIIVSKKYGQNYCSWSVSYGVTGDLDEGEKFEDALVATESRLKELLKKQLPVPEAVQLRLAKTNGS